MGNETTSGKEAGPDCEDSNAKLCHLNSIPLGTQGGGKTAVWVMKPQDGWGA